MLNILSLPSMRLSSASLVSFIWFSSEGFILPFMVSACRSADCFSSSLWSLTIIDSIENGSM